MKRTSILILLFLFVPAISLLHAGACEGASTTLGSSDTAAARTAEFICNASEEISTDELPGADTLHARGNGNVTGGDTLHINTREVDPTVVHDLGLESSSTQLSLSSDSRSRQQPDSMFWFIKRKPLALGATLAFSIPIVLLEYQWWWRKDYLYKQHGFLYQNDGGFDNYSLGVDKCGHFFTSYVYFHTFYDLMKWADYSEATAVWTALAVPAAHAISIELMDGYAKYGFSSYDLAANALGMGYAFAQVKVPALRNFNFKWSYYPTGAYSRPDQDWGLSHDYSGHIYWMSVNMKNVLPEGAARYWPKFLNLAVGYGASNVSYGDEPTNARHKFAFSLDYNLSSFDIANDTWAMVVRLLDKFHYPAPGLRYISGEKVEAKPFILN
ncbi:MAG TPA: DUF2279 domain-containing protein [Bacteroidota bacterium]|nr:DUF2279 domain-containing protein [Bacteroidota bacterium]